MVHSVAMQVSDQVGELLIHCRYGCRPVQNFPGLYEFDPTGAWRQHASCAL